MLADLTQYLWQYKNLCIPHVGCLHVVHKPAVFDVVEKVILPPSYALEFNHKGEINEHLLSFLSHKNGLSKTEVRQYLDNFGIHLNEHIHKQPFTWNGVGVMEKKLGGGVDFKPEKIIIDALQPVTAHKVLREDVQHRVLVGSEELLSSSFAPEEEKITKKKKASAGIVVAWIIILLAILFIGYFIYTNYNSGNLTGNRARVTSETAAPTYRQQ